MPTATFDVVESVERGVRSTRRSMTSTWMASTTSSPTGSSPTTRSTASAAPTCATSSTSRRTSPTRGWSSSSRTTARPRRSCRAANAVIANNRGGIAKRLWSELGQGEQIQLRALDDEHAEARFVVGEIQRLLDEGASRAEIAVLYRTNAMSRVIEETLVARGDRLPGDRRHEVLRARRDQGRDRLPVAARQPLRRGQLHACRQLAAARASAQTSLARVLAHADALDVPVWEAAAAPSRCPGSARPRSRRWGASWTRWTELARQRRASAGRRAGGRSASCSRRCCRRPATSRRSRPSARSRRRGGSRTSSSWWRWRREFDAPAAEGEDTLEALPAGDRARGRRRQPQRRRGPRDADDAAQRQGPRVPDRVHRRPARTACSRTRARSTRAAWRRSAACSTSASPARCASST